MEITQKNLEKAVVNNILSAEQATALMDFLMSSPDIGPSFNFTNLLYYFGGLIAIGAMSLFMNLGWDQFGGWGIFYISLAYAGIGLKLSGSFEQKGHIVPAGIAATFVLALTPLAIYGLQNGMGWWPVDRPYQDYHRYIEWYWIYLELGTLAVGIAMVWWFRYPFLVMPVAVTLWYMSMDVADMLTEGFFDWKFKAFISMWLGLLTTLLAFWVDLRGRNSADFAFWLYLFGVMAFWGGLTSQDSNSEIGKFLYFCINVFLIVCGATLIRRIFVAFGGMGCVIYFYHLADTVFKDSWFFPVALTAIGLVIMYGGIIWQRNEKAITRRLHQLLPVPLRELLETRAG